MVALLLPICKKFTLIDPDMMFCISPIILEVRDGKGDGPYKKEVMKHKTTKSWDRSLGFGDEDLLSECCLLSPRVHKCSDPPLGLSKRPYKKKPRWVRGHSCRRRRVNTREEGL